MARKGVKSDETINRLCREIVDAIIDRTDAGETIRFDQDFPGSITISNRCDHGHPGIPDGSRHRLIEEIRNYLVGGLAAEREEPHEL